MNNEKDISYFQIVYIFLLTLLVGSYPFVVLHPDLFPKYLSTNVFLIASILIAVAITFLFIWWLGLNRNSFDESLKMKRVFENIIAYFLALGFTKWACLKFFHLHMTTSLVWMEMPQTMLSGYQKASHFYGQNFPLVAALGVIELLGAIFILFSRTRVLGAFILTSACVNILLMDISFQITRPILEASILLAASCYFIFKEKEKLLRLFFKPRDINENQTFVNKRLRFAINISAFLIPILIFLPNYKPQLKQTITGKYTIIEIHNPNENKVIDEIASQFDFVYFDLGEFFAFTSNDFEKRQVGILNIDEKTRNFSVNWLNTKNTNVTFTGMLNQIDSANKTKIIGQINGDPIEIKLRKEKIKSIWNTY